MSFGSFEMTGTVLCSDLASCGYVVASVGHPGTAAAVKYDDGRVIRIDPKLVETMRSSELMDAIMPLFEEFKVTDENEERAPDRDGSPVLRDPALRDHGHAVGR